MPVIIALLRGINVGGRNTIAMAELRALLESLGMQDVQTVLQSGNVVFRSQAFDRTMLVSQLEEALEQRFGFRPAVMIRTHAELADLLANSPLKAEDVPNASHLLVMFLSAVPQPEAIQDLLATHSGPEIVFPRAAELVVHYVEGVGRSKLTNAWIERRLNVMGTARNWNTVGKLADLAARLEQSLPGE